MNVKKSPTSWIQLTMKNTKLMSGLLGLAHVWKYLLSGNHIWRGYLPAFVQAPIDFMLYGRLDDGEEIGLSLIPGYSVSVEKLDLLASMISQFVVTVVRLKVRQQGLHIT